MECFNCGATLTNSDFCNACGVDVKKYKKIMYFANRCYNEGLARANVRDLSGAVKNLKTCLRLNKNHIEARNLLGLIYYETGETVAGLSEWVISKNIRAEKNIADDFLEKIQSNPGRLDAMTSTIKKYNKSLELCYQGSNDLAIIQLKKIVSMNPKYVQARRLLALLCIEKGEYDKAKKELEKCLQIDKGDLDSRRYYRETMAVLNPVDEKKDKNRAKKAVSSGVFDENAAMAYKEGNEVIIQPINGKDPKAISILIEILIGFAVGLCVTYFLIVPSKVEEAKNNMNAEIATYGETIDKKNTEIAEMQNRVEQLEQNNLELKDSLETYEGSNGAIDANNYLLSAAYQYIANSNFEEVENNLELVGNDYLESAASFEFKELYEYLLAQIGDSVAKDYYDSGILAYNQMDYSTAISDLGKAYMYNPGSDEALYYLALSYYESGDVNKATEKFNQLTAEFPTSAYYDKALQHLEEMGQ